MKIHSFSGINSIQNTKYLWYFFSAVGVLFLLLGMVNWYKQTIRISWIANSQLNVLGYNILRLDINSDQYVRINAGLITDDIDPFRSKDFTYIDQSPPRNPVINYRIQEIRLDGSMNISEPIEITNGAWERRFLFLGLLTTCSSFLALSLMHPSRIGSLLHRYSGSPESQA